MVLVHGIEVRVRSILHNVFVAQLVLEHLTFNEGVTGSSPVGDTKNLVNLSDLYQKMVIFVKKN